MEGTKNSFICYEKGYVPIYYDCTVDETYLSKPILK